MYTTSFSEVVKNTSLVLFNAYPEIINKLEAYDDEPLYSQFNDDDDDDYYHEIYQWYLAGISEYEADLIEENTGGAVKFYYSEALDAYILPVDFFGLSWDDVPVKVNNLYDMKEFKR